MNLDFNFTIRINKKELELFKKWCEKAKKEYQNVLREVISAAPDGRLNIIPEKEQKKALKELYK